MVIPDSVFFGLVFCSLASSFLSGSQDVMMTKNLLVENYSGVLIGMSPRRSR